MIITSDITASDLRALYWRVMLPERLRLGFAMAVPGAIMWFFLARAESPEFLVVLRYIGKICFWVSLWLSVSFLWTYLTSRTQWAAWIRAAGKYTCELEDRQLTVTDAEGRREFPTQAIKTLEETPEHIFIIMRQGPHYIIPRRGLTTDEEEAVKSFREAVAFASLHVDMLHENQMPREEAVSEFKVARWVAAGFVLALAFTLGSGVLPARALVTAILCAVILLFGAVGSWRSRHRGLLLAALLFVWFLGPSFAGAREQSFLPIWGLQWLCLTGCLSTLPLLIFPRFFRRLGKLDEADVA